MSSCRSEVEETIRTAAAVREAWLAAASPELRASVPLDATGVTEAIALLARAVGIEGELGALQRRAHAANAAVLHGRVFGRVPVGRDTILAAFADGATVRRAAIARLAEVMDGLPFRAEIERVLGPEPEADLDVLRATYAAHERAVIACARRLDEVSGR